MVADLRDLANTFSDTPTGGDSSFRKGLRSGSTAAGGQLRGLAGRVGETLGADQFAKDQYAQSALAQQQAAAEAPEVNDFHQVNGLRSAGSFLAGQAGQMLPALGAGVAGAVIGSKLGLKGTFGNIAGATIGTAPLTVGQSIERTQADPHAANAPLAERNLIDFPVGFADSLVSNAVPAIMGGKLIGNAGEHAIAQASKKAILAKNLSEGVLGNAAASAGSEKLHQAVDTHYDPNRDTSQDNQHLFDAAATGAIVGAPFGAVGAAGEIMHGGSKAPAPSTSSLNGMKDSVSGAAKSAYGKVSDMFAGKKDPVDLGAKDIAAGKDPVASIDPEVLAKASPEAQAAMVQDAETSRVDQVKKMAEDLYNDHTLSPESKDALSQMGDDFGSAANQIKVAGMKVAQDAYKQMSSTLDSAHESIAKHYGEKTKDENNSEMGDGLRQVVSETVMPFLQENHPELLRDPKDIQNIGDSIRMIAATASKGDVDINGYRYLRSVFGGPALRDMIVQIHEAMGTESDPVATEHFMKTLGKLQHDEVTTESLSKTVEKSYDKDALAENLKQDPQFVQTMVDGIRAHVDQSAYANMSKARAEMTKTDFEQGMRREFGNKADSVLAEFAKDAEKTSPKSQFHREIDDPFSDGNNGRNKYNEDGHDKVAEPSHELYGAEAYDKPRYYGVGRDEFPGMLDHPSDHLAKYGSESPAEKLLAKARKENPDHNVEIVRHEDLPPDVQAKYPGGAGKVLVRAEGMKQMGRMSPEDLDTVRVDTKIASHRESPSRIDTGVKGAVIDARKLAKLFGSEDRTPYNKSDDASGLHRIAHVFMEGVAAMQDHLGKSFEVPDSTVVSVHNGHNITWGELKKLDPASGKVPSLTTQLLRDGTHQEVTVERNRLQDVVDKHNNKVQDHIDELVQRGFRPSKEAVRAIYEEQATPASRRAKKDLYQIEKGLEKRYAENDIDGEASRAKYAEERTEQESGQGGSAKTLIEKGKQKYSPDDTPQLVRSALKDDEAYSGAKGRSPKPLSTAEEGLVNHVNMDGTPFAHTGETRKGPPLPKRPSGEDRFAELAAKRTELDARNGAPIKIKDHNNVPKLSSDKSPLMMADYRIAKMSNSASKPVKEMAATLKALRAVLDEMGASDRKRFVAEVATAEKPADLREVVHSLADKYLDHNESVVDAKKPSDRSNQKVGAFTSTPAERAAVEKTIKDQLGPQVEVSFEKLFHAGDYERIKDKSGMLRDSIRLSVHALDPMSVGYHEALHGFIQHMREADLHGVNDALYKAADSIYVKGKLREFLKNEPEALKQIEGSAEERAAYMYQMWAAGKLKLNDAPRSALEKISDFVKKTLGIWTASKRAEHIMEYFNSGEYAKDGMYNRSAVARALLESGTNKTVSAIKGVVKPLSRLADNIIAAGDSVLADMHNPAVDRIRKLINANTSDEGQGTGFISAARVERTKIMNGLMDSFGKLSATPEHMREALESLQTSTPATSPEGRLAARAVRNMLDGARDYMKEAGVDLGDRGQGKDYFPVVWDTSYIASHQKEFRAMLDKYVKSGDIKNPDEIIQKLLVNDGNEFGIKKDRQTMQSAKFRSLDFIAPEDRAQFLEKNLVRTINSYVTQATRRAEWTRRFGDDGSKLVDLLKEAKDKHGASDADIAKVDKFLKGVDGTLGDTIDPNLRRLYGNAIVYQNLRLLPMAVFSMAVDPGGIMVRGGTVKDAFNAFKRGITEVKRSFQKNPGKDEWYELAQTMGVIDDTALMHTLGTSYSQGMVGDTGRKINDTFFRYNLVEQMNTSMRVAAVPAAMGFIAKHADTKANIHSARWMSELDLKPSDVVVKNGRPLVTQQEFIAHGYGAEKALAAETKMRLAVNKWVDGAILRPNAAHKPVWMNDPHFALVAHLKQFVYSFNETIIKRVVNEAKHGNYTPAYALASYVPTMMAADFIKGMIVGGGAQPAYKQGWDAEDYLGNGMQRAGLFGVAQFGLDAYKDIKFGGTGIGALSGPMIEQLGDGIKTLGGKESASSFVMDSLPASSIAKAISKSGESKADSMFAE